MSSIAAAGVSKLGDLTVNRLGYGAMQLAGPGVFGPPKDAKAAIAVLREAVDQGVNHIDTSDYYGPHVTNQLIREALHPYPKDLVIATKVGAVRGEDGSWKTDISPAGLTRAIHDNLRNLGRERLDVVNFRSMLDRYKPVEGSIARQIEALAELKRQGLIQHIGVSHVTPAQVAEARSVTEVAGVQNFYNIVHRVDDTLIDALHKAGIAYVPYFPLGGFSTLQSSVLSEVAAALGATPMQVALAWLLARSPNILLIPGTSSLAHLRENLAVAQMTLPKEQFAKLDAIGGAQNL